MNPKDIASKYLADSKTMQLATVAGNQPWISTVYFVADERMNLYWLSWPSRRHSLEISQNNKAAIAIAIKLDQPVIGLQAEGTVSIVEDSEEVAKVMKLYTAKYGSGQKFYKNFITNRNQHNMYKFIAKKFVLFDEVNFPDDSPLEIEK